MTATDIIAALGGYRSLAAVLGVDASRVFRWQREGIPAHRWRAVLAEAERQGRAEITADALARAVPSTESAA
jgi:phage terminase Nu1 subunit (DNA packaging protein)